MNKELTVGHLIELLETFDDDALIVLSSDEEGNSYRTLWNMWQGTYMPYDRELYLSELTDELIEAGYSEEDVRSIDQGRKAVILY